MVLPFGACPRLQTVGGSGTGMSARADAAESPTRTNEPAIRIALLMALPSAARASDQLGGPLVAEHSRHRLPKLHWIQLRTRSAGCDAPLAVRAQHGGFKPQDLALSFSQRSDRRETAGAECVEQRPLGQHCSVRIGVIEQRDQRL